MAAYPSELLSSCLRLHSPELLWRCAYVENLTMKYHFTWSQASAESCSTSLHPHNYKYIQYTNTHIQTHTHTHSFTMSSAEGNIWREWWGINEKGISRWVVCVCGGAYLCVSVVLGTWVSAELWLGRGCWWIWLGGTRQAEVCLKRTAAGQTEPQDD